MIVVFSFTYKSSLHILIFFFCHAAGGILVPPPGIEPTTSALEAQSLNHCIQAHYIYCALYFYCYYISSTSDPHALDPGSWGALFQPIPFSSPSLTLPQFRASSLPRDPFTPCCFLNNLSKAKSCHFPP